MFRQSFYSKFCFCLFLGLTWVVGSGQILTFDFAGLTGNEATASSNFSDVNLTSSSITRGSGLTASNNGNRFNATNWNTGNIDDAISDGDYMEFTITPNSGFEFNISSIQVNVQRSNTGPRSISLRSSIDGYTSDLGIGSQNILDNISTQVFTFSFTQSSSSPISYRFYLHNAEASGGSGGFEGSGNDIIVNGSTSSVSPAQEGWQITAESTPFIIDFDTTVPNVNNDQFDGSGFRPAPATGQLDSNALIIKGLEDGDLNFGDTGDIDDFALGISSGGVSRGGVYAFETSSNNFSLGIQPSSNDFTSGSITLKIQNKTGSTVNAILLEYLIYFFNDENRSNSFNFSYSLDNNNYFDVSSLDLTSTEAADASPLWNLNSRGTTLTGLTLNTEDFIYFRWTGEDIAGLGSRDEFALDDISVNFNPDIPIISVSDDSISNLSYGLGEGPSISKSFTVSGSNLEGDINLDLGSASNFEISIDPVNNYTTTLTLPESSGEVLETTIFVRLKVGLGEANYSDTIVFSSTNADDQFLELNGRVKEKLELFISEIANPGDIGNAKYIELFNASVDTLDFDSPSVNYYFAVQFNGGSSIDKIKLSGKIPPKEYYIIDSSENNEFEDTYEILSDLEISSFLGNGNDSYFLSTSGMNNEDAKNTMFDIYGQIDKNGDSEPWNYTNSRVYRINPSIKVSNLIWDIAEWQVIFNPMTPNDMTPGYGDNDYIFDGAWSNTGIGTDPDGVSTGSQNIFVRSGTVALNQDTEIGDLVVRENATIELKPDVKLTVTGDIVNEGTIIFESNDTSTAVLEAVQPNTRVVGNGFEIHRRIPVQNGIRAFRYLSSSVNTNSSIFDNWQEGGATILGRGTHITGAIGTVGGISPNGFDYTSTGSASMYNYDPNLSLPWEPIPNTNATNFSVGDAYAILIRGDRTSPLNTNDQTGPSTTLRTTGQIRVGDFEVQNLSNTTGHFNLVGNPYQSQVDLNALLNSPNSTDVDNSVAYVWDPTLGSLGGYAVLDFSMLPITDPSTIINYGITTPNTSDANQFLQPQQAFFVETTGPNTKITFTESIKNNNESQSTTFSLDAPNFSILDITLIGESGLTYDGLRLVYGDEFSNTIDSFDATKFWNYTDNLSILSNENYISIEKRSIPSTGEVTPLYFGSQSLASYAFEIELSPNEEFDVYLVDQYRAQTIAIPEDIVFNYSFSVDANIPESIANGRFELTYENTSLNTEDVTSLNFSIYPNPLESDESLYIRSSGEIISKITSIELLNLNGQVIEVLSLSNLESENNLTKLDFESRPVSGIYLLNITTNQNVIINKIIIK